MLNTLKSILNTSDIMTSILDTSDRISKKVKGQGHSKSINRFFNIPSFPAL